MHAYSADTLAYYIRDEFISEHIGFDFEKAMDVYFDTCEEERNQTEERGGKRQTGFMPILTN